MLIAIAARTHLRFWYCYYAARKSQKQVRELNSEQVAMVSMLKSATSFGCVGILSGGFENWIAMTSAFMKTVIAIPANL